MRESLQPLRFVLLVFAGLVNREQARVVAFVREENRVPREHLGEKRFRLADGQRRRRARSGRFEAELARPDFRPERASHRQPPPCVRPVQHDAPGLAAPRRSRPTDW
ncbi:MAG: hypothetical protein FJ265_04885 [Planctomycetes bacterium]|nr:hypothetical protein [Planctomycetota bacterium]